MKKINKILRSWWDGDVVSETATYDKLFSDRVEVRRINDRIDELLLYKDHEVLFHLEELDKGIVNVVLYYGGQEKRFSIVSKSKIKIIEQ